MKDEAFLCPPYKEVWLQSLDEIEFKLTKLRKKAVYLYLNHKAFKKVLDDIEVHEIVYFAKKFDLSFEEAVQYHLINDKAEKELDVDLLETIGKGYS